ncbi:hypothetical protein [Prosthecobacter fluviatilis]|uniref:Uncharacterized protein n=1 Tax=Prosthecobacter fluviatilis TaxID=445931 RepID=A0ABW0KNP6_9BACT
MKKPFSCHDLSKGGILITCSSHEGRCKGIVAALEKSPLSNAIVFHYDDVNDRREEHHSEMIRALEFQGAKVNELIFTESCAVQSLHNNMGALKKIISLNPSAPILLDITVFTKRHLLMMLRWLDDNGCWDRLFIAYTEPDEYDVSEYVPLSFGLKSIEQIPGFSACPDMSRPTHLMLFLGYEGDRALAAYEHVQPMCLSIAIPYPPYKPKWSGRTEQLNKELLALVGGNSLIRVDAVDPAGTVDAMNKTFGDPKVRSEYSRIVCPIGTKPQTFGMYCYIRECEDPPAVLYPAPLRHNHGFFSHGIGPSWTLKGGETE